MARRETGAGPGEAEVEETADRGPDLVAGKKIYFYFIEQAFCLRHSEQVVADQVFPSCPSIIKS